MSASDLRARLPSSRRDAEDALDRLVRDNRFTISVFFPLNGAVLLVASAMGWLPDPLAFNAFLILLGTLVMRSPLIVGVLPLVTRRAALGVGALTAYAYAIEYTGVTTGWPYGWFHYGVDLGPTVAGVPVGLPVFFIPLVMNAYLLCLLLLGDRARNGAVRLGVVTAAVLAMDVVLDPGAVALGFWEYYRLGDDALLFYGVPLSNYAGWVVSATVAVVALDRSFDREALLARLDRTEFMLDDLVSFVILWGGINAWFGNWIPVAVAALFGVGLLKTDRFDSRLLRLPRRLPWRS
ncbi:carotenoid biosynthesis protein [Haloferax volcanii]|uniref:Carotenoid biosynthesis protein n=3 Tax=Haloferax volcanii TaxID=2246 RepID=A0A6C0UVP9_HALVO|nr:MULTISPECIES: bisanhydrobacterioruberin hydratase [Haloferax]MBC9987209.1 carotenoid biosynthesis protein [Haloferax sp. AS1]ELK50859.1 putative carotenoid biosynthesis protein [Haloferax sp. BAB-2207]ELZ76375.1 putative carotenoid biosynthesis protein [Haloferax lucentense DSM 14919]ELZ86875.1 putative carotenoid biosynthesis protein [Haloferax alexandrinus JCM 10717]NLV04138.1 carotenoid biosynthesis protein [Haloferax alexandrinus]